MASAGQWCLGLQEQGAHLRGEDGGRHVGGEGGDGDQVGQPEEQGATVDDDVDEVPVRLVRTAREDASDAHRRCQAQVAYAADML